MVTSIVVGLHLAADFRATPSGFPWSDEEPSGRATTETLGRFG